MNPTELVTPKIEAYVIAHPGCTGKDICAALGLSKHAVNVSLGRLRAAGKTRRLPQNTAHRAQRWEAGAEMAPVYYEPMGEGAPKQRTVFQWAPPAIAPQHWLSSLGL